MMQSPEAQYQLALKMPMDRLVGILQGRPDAVVGQPIAMMALKALKEQKTAFQGQQAQAQLQQPNVKDQLLAEDQGIATYPADNMDGVAEAAHGGVVGYADGGDVQRFYGGGMGAIGPEFGGAPIEYIQNVVTEDEVSRIADALRKQGRTIGLADIHDIRSGRLRAPVPPVSQPGAQQTTKPGPQQRPQAAPIPYTGPIPDAQSMGGEEQQSGIQSLMPAATQPTQEQAQTPQANLETYEDVLRKSQVAGADYRTQITDLVKQMTASPEEKAKERETRLGTGLLSIASDLLEPGQTSSGARGKAFKTIAGLASQYSKEDKADKRANIGFELSTRMGIAQLEQGDRKNATDLFNHAQTIAVQQADMAGKRAMHAYEMSIKDRALSLEEKRDGFTNAYHNAYIGVMQEANKIKERLGMRQIAAEGTRAAAVEQRERAANLRTYVDVIKAELASTPPPNAERRKALQAQLDSLTRSLSGDLGIAGAVPRSIQLPDAAPRGARIHELE